MNVVYLVPGIFCICMIMTALGLLLRGDGSRDQKLMQFFLMGSLVQNVGYMLEMMAPVKEAAVMAVKVQYMGSLAVPLSYCYFMFSYCHEKAPEKILNLLKFVDIFIMGLVFTCDLHPYYYRQISWLETGTRHGFLSLDYGPGYWLFMVCGMAIPHVLSQYALVRACIKRSEYAADRKYKLMLVLSLLPVGAFCAYATKLTHEYDPTPFVLGLMLASVVILIWSRKVYDFGSLASEILLDSMSGGVIALDEQNRIVKYNMAATRIFAELRSNAAGKHIMALKGFPQDMLGEDVQKEFSLNGCFYQGNVKQILDKFGQKKGYVILILNITERRNYIEQIKQAREEAEQANSAKSAFLANMSHEIRTPMNAIVGLSDIIMEQCRRHEVYEYACDIKASSRNLLALINDILDLSKVEAGRMELLPTEYHLKTIVDEVLNMMDIMASQRGILLESEYDMSIPCRYLGDEGRIKQILINLLNNALKFTKEGHVKISVAGEPGGTEDTERLIFRIEDTGCGIREEDLERIFDNFRQVDSKRNRSAEGTGLGLSITKHLVELMHGQVKVESVYGEGSTFIVDILQKIIDHRPLSEVSEVAVKREKKPEPFMAPDCKVLVVDDNMVNRKVARMFLQSYGMKIDEADSGPEAIERVQGMLYDIIFMDHMMPGMDGIETVKVIRETCGENGTLPIVIALTANAMEGVRENFLKNGFQDFMTKPLDRRLLHDMLLKWIPKEKQEPGKTWADEEQLEKEYLDDSRRMEYRDITIKGIDTDAAAERFSGNVQDYRELLSLYCLDGKRKLTLLRELWEKQDYKNYGIEVHALKSASANVGAMRLSDSAKEHEMAVDCGNLGFVDSHVFQLLGDFEEQLSHIQEFLSENRQTEDAGSREHLESTEEKTEISKADLVREIKEALESLEDFLAKDCAHKIVNILQYRLGNDIQAQLMDI